MIPRVVTDTAADAAFLGAAWVAERARMAVRERGKFSVALAGGESPKALYAELRARTDIEWSRWDVFLGDERAVPESDPRSNLRGVRETLLAHVPIAPERVHPMYVPGLDLGAMADAYERLLRGAIGEPVTFDVVLLGLGKDAHTLSLHPGCAALGERERDVVALPSPPMDPPLARITLTPLVVERARSVLLIASGASKSAAVRAVCEAPDDRLAFPGQLLRDASGAVLCLFDEAAGALLGSKAN